MSVTELPPAPSGDESPQPGPQLVAWRAAEATAVEVMGAVNAGVARLVGAVASLLEIDGWVGAGIRSPEHWVSWKAGVSHGRAEGLVRIARRVDELPECFGLFAEGRLTEDAMVRIARRVPAVRDAEVAAVAPTLLISQLDRLLRSLPEQPDGSTERPEPERMCRVRESRDGWTRGEFCLPADEGAVLRPVLSQGATPSSATATASMTPTLPMPRRPPPARGRCRGPTGSSASRPKASTPSTPSAAAPATAVSGHWSSCTSTSTPTANSGRAKSISARSSPTPSPATWHATPVCRP